MSNTKKENKILKRFGRYLLLDHLVDGGMAKICRARFLGDQADKIVAIKMIQPQYSKDPAFAKMFMDEIKVTFGLIHPNIAQTYDTGMIDDQLFAAMEYVDGKNLKQFTERLKSRNFVFPVEISVHIISQVCQALNYAHNFTDKLTGERLNIIHRDISPHNIMLTYDGSVKVIDFGIAKADNSVDKTQAGTIKGKISYLAPEYLDGKTLDGRYDQFSIGITMWELLCSRKLFKAKNELAALKLIQACKIPPPSSINPNVDKELDQIVLKALSKDRANRYENLDQMNRALVKFLYSNYPDFNPTDISYFAKELFKDEIQQDRKVLYEFGQMDVDNYLDQNIKESSPEDTKAKSKTIKVKKKKSSGKDQVDFDGMMGESSTPLEAFEQSLSLGLENTNALLDIDSVKNEKKKSLPKKKVSEPTKTKRSQSNDTMTETEVSIADSKLKVKSASKYHNEIETDRIISKVNDLDIVSNGKNSRLRSSASTTNQFSSFPEEVKSTNTDRLVKRKIEEEQKSKTVSIVASILIIFGILFYFDVTPKKIVSMIKGEKTKPVKKENKLEDPDEEVLEEMGFIKLNNVTPLQIVYIDNEEVSFNGIGVNVPIGKDIIIKITEDGKYPYVQKLKVSEEDDSVVLNIPNLRVAVVGEVISDLNFTTGDKIIITTDQQVFTKALPLKKPLRIPAGTYDAKIVNDVMKTEKIIRIKVEPNKRYKISL